MYKGGALLLYAAFFCHLFGLSQWQSPDKNLRYHEVCFLTAHNAYAAYDHGYSYAQQRWSIEKQLAAGVRGLMLDTHKDSKTGAIILCHRNEWVNKALCGCKSALQLNTILETIKQFLIKHPSEIITIFLENYVTDKQLIDRTLKAAGLEPFILTPSLCTSKDGWPTIQWMQENNKRLVIFNSIEKTELIFNQWEHVVENQWGALYQKYAGKERPESRAYHEQKRYLYAVNYFPRLKVNFGKGYAFINTQGLETCLAHLQNGLGNGYCQNRLPNFICLDFIDEGDGIYFVNKINEQAKKDPLKNLFRAL